MKWIYKTVPIVFLLMAVAIDSQAQGMGDNISKMQTVLSNLKTEMMPLCEKLLGVGKGIAGFAALFYIASRIWRHISNAEPIDFFPLFRPFVLGFCIAFFPMVIKMMDGLLEPTVTGTADMVKDSDKAIKILLKLKAEAIKETRPWRMYVGQNNEGSKELWLKYTNGLDENDAPVSENMFESMGSSISFAMAKASYRFRNSVKEWMSEILNILFQAAALCINTIRTFQLIVLAIIGPLVFGIAVFDGFQHTLTSWIAKYINVFLWLPVCNIFGAIIGKLQEQMLKLDLSQIGSSGDTFFSASDTGYLVFMIIGIIGYFTVPSVAGFVVNAGGGGAMMQKVNSIVMAGAGGAQMAGMAVGSRAGEGAYNMANMGRYAQEGLSGEKSGAGMTGSIGRAIGSSQFAHDRISGGADSSGSSGGGAKIIDMPQK